jgi:hypothetical protein
VRALLADGDPPELRPPQAIFLRTVELAQGRASDIEWDRLIADARSACSDDELLEILILCASEATRSHRTERVQQLVSDAAAVYAGSGGEWQTRFAALLEDLPPSASVRSGSP